MYNESQLKVASLILKDKVFKYEKTKGTFEGFTFYFTAKVTGQRIMYSMGEPHPVIQVDVKIVKIEGLGAGVFKAANHLRKTFNRVEMLGTYNFNNGMDYIMGYIGSQLSQTFKVLDSNVSVQVENMTIPDDVEILDGLDLYKKKITESRIPRTMVRGIVQKIVNILKKKEQGEYNIPFMVGGEEYKVIVDVRFNNQIESARDFDLQPYFNEDTGDVEILIQIDPERLEKNLFAIIGELNDDMTHEMQHSRQSEEGRLSDDEFDGSNFEYFMQPDEIEAQYFGLKQKAKSMGLPFEDVIDDWFMFRQDKFGLTDNEVAKIKNSILRFRPSQLS
jgi:hypothetical protein